MDIIKRFLYVLYNFFIFLTILKYSNKILKEEAKCSCNISYLKYDLASCNVSQILTL